MESVHETQWKLVHGINFNVVMMDSMKISRLTQKKSPFSQIFVIVRRQPSFFDIKFDDEIMVVAVFFGFRLVCEGGERL